MEGNLEKDNSKIKIANSKPLNSNKEPKFNRLIFKN